MKKLKFKSFEADPMWLKIIKKPLKITIAAKAKKNI